MEPSLFIHDLNNNPLAIVPLGKARIKIGYIRILHPINLLEIETTINNIDDSIIRHPTYNQLYNLVRWRKEKLYESFLKLRPRAEKRQKRWDLIGSVRKEIAGSPDADDLRIIERSLHSLAYQNNKQIMINDAIEKRINSITDTTNQIIKLERQRSEKHTVLINLLIILFNMETLQEQIEALEEAVIMAKHGIASSKLLTSQDLKTIKNFLQNYGVHLSTFEELLSQSTAQVMINNTHMIYTLKVTQTSEPLYDYNYIDSLIKNQKGVSIGHNYLLQNSSKVYELSQPCQEKDHIFVCENAFVIEPSECIDRITKGKNSNCTFEKVYSNGIIKRINQATLLINNAVARVQSNCSETTQTMNGSFLIIFEKCNLWINGITYSNFETTIQSQSYFPTTGIFVKEVSIKDAPPLEYIQNMTLEHRDRLDTVQFTNRGWKHFILEATGIPTMILLVLGLSLFCFRRRREKINIRVPTFTELPATATTEDQ